jgi:hypothetical protein
VRKVMDIVDNRVEANLQAIQHTLLVELPADRCVLHCSSCYFPSRHPRHESAHVLPCNSCDLLYSQRQLACRDSRTCKII